MSAITPSHSTTPTAPPISTVSMGRYSIDCGTLYNLVMIVSSVVIAVFAILETQYLVAACAITLSAFVIYSCFNREPIPQNPPQLSAVTSTQQLPSLGTPLDASASTPVASSENDVNHYDSLDEEVELGSLHPQCAQQAVNPLIVAPGSEQRSASGLPLERQVTYSASPYQITTAHSLSQVPSDDESKREEAISLNFSSISSSDEDEDPPHTEASGKLEKTEKDVHDPQEAKKLRETLKATFPSKVQYRDDKDPVEFGTYIFDYLLDQGKGGVQLDPKTEIYTVSLPEAKRVAVAFREATAKKLNGYVVEPVLSHTKVVQFRLREGGMELFGDSLTVSAKIKVGIVGEIGVDATVEGLTGEAPHPFAATHMLGAIRLNERTNSVVRGFINNVICPLMNTDLSQIRVRREPAIRLLHTILHPTK